MDVEIVILHPHLSRYSTEDSLLLKFCALFILVVIVVFLIILLQLYIYIYIRL